MQWGKQIEVRKEELGKLAEKIITEFLIENGVRILRPDYLLEDKNGNLFFLEVKILSRYLPTERHSLEGHGLSLSQVQKYMSYYIKHKIRCFLLVIEPETGFVWGQYLDELEKLSEDKKYKTKKQNIIIYSLEGFKRRYKIEEWLKRTGYIKEIKLKFILSEIERFSKDDNEAFFKQTLEFLSEYERENKLKFLKMRKSDDPLS
jgi:hypothetical protein